MNSSITKATIVFAVLFTAGVVMVVAPFRLATGDLHQVLIPVGSALIGGALGFYLVEMFAIDRG
jgi:hypothetical protein